MRNKNLLTFESISKRSIGAFALIKTFCNLVLNVTIMRLLVSFSSLTTLGRLFDLLETVKLV